MEVINKYRGKSAESVSPAEKSLAAGGTGVVRQDTNMQAAQAQRQRTIMNAAGAESAEGKLMDEQRKQANLQRDNQITQLGQQSKAEKQQYELKSNEILNNLESQMDKLTSAERMDQMASAATYLRLQDEKYRYELADVGRRKRLDDAAVFDMEMQRAVFSDAAELLRDNLEFQKLLTLDDAEFRKRLAQINIDVALGMAKSDAGAKTEVAGISAAGNIATGIVSGIQVEKAGKS
jgi:hypothetical protein